MKKNVWDVIKAEAKSYGVENLYDYEMYERTDNELDCDIHTDRLNSIYEDDEEEIKNIILNGECGVDWEVTFMDEETYEHTVCANSCVYADFEGWYGDKNAVVAIITVKQDREELEEKLAKMRSEEIEDEEEEELELE